MSTESRSQEMSVKNITISINGSQQSCEDGLSIEALLENLGLNIERVVVELNHKALTRSEAKAHQLQDKDSLEFIRIVAGGWWFGSDGWFYLFNDFYLMIFFNFCKKN